MALITILFIFPLYKAGLPWEDDFSWELTNYTVLWFAGIGIVFGGWWFLSAKNWFTGPCAWAPRRSSSGWRRSSARGSSCRPSRARSRRASRT